MIKYFDADELPQELIQSHFEVTVLVSTYNHERFIERCLYSILSQNFESSFCLLIVDDCSTDGTTDVVKKILRSLKLPRNVSIFFIRHVRNLYQRGRETWLEIFNCVNSNFFALCEGDDAWNDPNKIQKQHSFLTSTDGASFSACGHDSIVCDHEGRIVSDNKLPEQFRRDYDPESLKRCQCWCLTNTLFFRGDIEFPLNLGLLPNGDNLIWSTLGFRGGFKFLEGIGKSIYTEHQGGIWSQKSLEEKTMMQAKTHLTLALHYYRISETALAKHFLGSSMQLLNRFGQR